MDLSVAIPLWFLVVVLVLATVAVLDRILVPSVRWFLRGRVERLVARLNTRLKRPIHPFRLLGRNDMIVRLIHDPAVLQAVVDHAHETGVPETVAFQEVRRYAREIVPGFSALVYFGFATGAARRLSRAFFDVKVDRVDTALEGIHQDATVVFVMNHRSNMDYVLVTWLVAGQSAISFAVGEWARIWPLSWLFRAMGAYFIRRGSHSTLYRRVLARYVQIVAAEGATQAMFPEGNLSLDGRVGPAKMGLLGYLLAGMTPTGRDIVFVPVGICYDRVLEDRILVEALAGEARAFRVRPGYMAGFLLRTFWRMIRGRFAGFGSAAVSFGPPLSLREHVRNGDASVVRLAETLMSKVAQAVPVLPVPLVAAALAEGHVSRGGLPGRVSSLVARLEAAGAILKLPEGGPHAASDNGLRALELRGIVVEREGVLQPLPGKVRLLDFYASSIQQRLVAIPDIADSR
jgi:glycerol-3-phosphate O-acyltransferase